MRLFHLVRPADWAAAAGTGEYAPPSLVAEGFVHFSFAGQVSGSANRHYASEPELVVLEVDSSSVPAPLRVEDSYGSGTAFPHVYGPVPVAAVLAVHRLDRAEDGSWEFDPAGPG